MMKKIMLGLLIGICVMLGGCFSLEYAKVAEAENSPYTVEFFAKGTWFFAPQECRLVLKKGWFEVCGKDIIVANDGKSLDDGNWNVEWDDEKATVTVMGEEQHDAIYYLYYDGRTDYRKERFIDFVFASECDDIYGMRLEYAVDRVRLGGQLHSADSDMTRPFPRQDIVTNISEWHFPDPDMPDNRTFGMLIYIVTENSEVIPIEYLWEWDAYYGETYRFRLSGNREQGYTLTPSDDNVQYTITPYSELPENFLSD